MRTLKMIVLALTLLSGTFNSINVYGQYNYRDRSDEPPPRRNDRPPRRDDRQKNRRDSKRGADRYNIEQAISDNAQLHTIAFSGLAFITGDFGASTFIPPGKVCDYFGFQYMRDIDVAEKGHNPMFLNRVAGNVLYNLSGEQKKLFADLAIEQAPQLEELAKMRLPLIKAFCNELNSKRPAGSKGLNKKAVIKCVGDIFAKDALLSLRRAEVMAKVAGSLTPSQKSYFSKMKFGDFSTWPEMDEHESLRELNRYVKGVQSAKRSGNRRPSNLINVAYMTYASEFFSWTAGSVKADTYFCPERHGTYFGGFYMKDMPAMGKRDYDISTSVTGDSGKAFIRSVLKSKQRANITSIIDVQRPMLKKIVKVRKLISIELRKLLDGKRVDEQEIVKLGRLYGELDGEMSWHYATAFARVNKTLTPSQYESLLALRNLDGYKSAPFYIYSEPDYSRADITGADKLFFAPK